MQKLTRSLMASIALLPHLSATHNNDLLTNGDLGQWHNGVPTAWISDTQVSFKQTAGPDPASTALSATVSEAHHLAHGNIQQTFTIKPQTRYHITGQIKGVPGMGYLQVDLHKNGEPYFNYKSERNLRHDWSPVEIRFHSADTDSASLRLQWERETDYLGKQIAFADLKIEELGPLVHHGEEVAPRAVPTFNSIGLYWKPTGGTATRNVSVEYRKHHDHTWSQALPLWFDSNEHNAPAAEHTAEYRGSIVGLEDGTVYEIKLTLEDGPTRTLTTKTRSNDFKIIRKVTLPETYHRKFEIFEGGNAEDGYILYEPAAGTEATWDVDGLYEHNLEIKASYIIVRGLTLKNARTHGIYLDDVHDVIIDDCDISGWGRTRADGQADNLNAAIYARSPVLKNIVIQHCDLHHPRSDSNSWQQNLPGLKSRHPEGPQGIVFYGGQGGHVIRHNRIYSDMEHMFNDGMGEVHNFGYAGFLVRDSDVHDNFISHCWDDALEIEGAVMNVRVWNNYMDMTYGAIGAAVPSLGPVYFYRNVYASSRKHEGTTANDLSGHYLFKIGNESAYWARGKMYLFHNTSLQPPPFEGSGSYKSSGAQAGIVYTSNRKKQEHITSRNNIFHMRSPHNWAIKDTQKTTSNDFDYDLYDGQTRFQDSSEAHGIHASPEFERAPDGRLWLAPNSPGHDAGERIPNFNDDYVGTAPDMGAVEQGDTQPKPATWPDFPLN